MNDEIERWLAAALRDAPANRRERLRAEITDHLEEAAAAYQARGLDEGAARAAALADLGDPRLTAAALRRFAPWLALPLTAGPRPGWAVALALALVLLAALAIHRPLALGAGSDVGQLTAVALIVQIAALTVALSLPLLFDDLDLSPGVMVMLGAYLALNPGGLLHNIGPLAPPDLLPLVAQRVALVGAGVGVLHGLIVVGLRLPAAAVTLIGGGCIALWLLGRPAINAMALSSEARRVMLAPSLLLLAGAWLTLCLFALAAARVWPPFAPPQRAAPTHRERFADVWYGACLGLPLIVTLGFVRLGWGSAPSLLVLALITAGTVAAVLWAYGPAVGEVQRRRVRRLLWATPIYPALLALTLLWPDQYWSAPGLGVWLLILLLPAAIVALAAAVILRGLWAGRGRAWLWPARPPRRAGWWRIAAMALGAGTAAALGACAGLQGLRDNTFVHATAFYTLLPLAGLVIGGQHLLPTGLRPIGALLGGLAVAVVTPMSSDNLDTGPAALLLAALFAALWRLALPPPRPVAASETGAPEGGTLPAGAEKLHRRLEMAR